MIAIAIMLVASYWLTVTVFVKEYHIIASIIKTHDSESRGQEEAAVRDERVSYLKVAPLKNSQTL